MYCANAVNGACIYAAAGAWDPADYFVDPCYGHQISPAGSTVACPRYVPPYLSRQNVPIARTTIYDTPWTVPSSGIRLEINDGDDSAPVESYPGTTNEDSGTVNDGSPAAGEFIGDGTLSAVEGVFEGMVVRFTAGALDGEVRPVTTYTGATKTFEFEVPFSGAPGNGDAFSIENLAVVDRVAWYAASGYMLGVTADDTDDGKYGLRYFGKFYAPETGDYSFLLVGIGEATFELDSVFYLGADHTDFQELDSSAYTDLPSAGTIPLTADTWYTIETRFRRVDTALDAGFCVMWRNNQNFLSPTVLSAGVSSYTGEFLSGETIVDYDNLQISRADDLEVSEASFSISLNASTEARGYYYDSSARSFVHNGSGPTISANKLVTVETGYRTTEGDGTEHDQYRTILTGHTMGSETKRNPSQPDSISITLHDFGHLLREKPTENYPQPLQYWIAGYLQSDRPNGTTAPLAWDAWELEKVFEVLMIEGGIDPILLRTRRIWLDAAEDEVQGEAMMQRGHPRVMLESKGNYGDPFVVVELTADTQEHLDDPYYFPAQYGEKILDVLNSFGDQYLWSWGFHSGGEVLPGVLEYTGGPYLKPRGNAAYTVWGMADFNVCWFGSFEGTSQDFKAHLLSVDGDTEDTTPKVDTAVKYEGLQSIKMAEIGEGFILGKLQLQKGQVYAISAYFYYDAGGGFDTDVTLRVMTPWTEGFDVFNPLDETLFSLVSAPGTTDINGDSTWRRYQVIFTAAEDENLTLTAIVSYALQASSFLYIDAIQVTALLKTSTTLRAYVDYDLFALNHANAIGGECLQGDVAAYPGAAYTVFYYPFTGTRADLIVAPGADLANSGNHITVGVYKTSDDSQVVSDQSFNLYHEAPNATRDIWYFYDGDDSSGSNPCVLNVTDSLPYDGYYLKVTLLKETPRINAVLVYGIDPTSAIDLPGVTDLTYRTSADASEPFQPGTVGSLDADLLTEEQRTLATVIGAPQGVWVPEGQNEDALIDPKNPVHQYVYARAIDRDAVFKPATSNYLGRISETMIVEPGISSEDRAKWLASFVIERNQTPGQRVPLGLIHSPILDPGDAVLVLDEKKDSVNTGVMTVRNVDSSIGKLSTDAVTVDSLTQVGSYIPRHSRDLGLFGGEFVTDIALENNGNIMGTLKGPMTNIALTCTISLPGSGLGSDVNSYPERGYILVVGNDKDDRQTYEFIHYEEISRDSVAKEVELTWSSLALHRGMEYRQRQRNAAGDAWINDTSISAIAHDAESTVYCPYDPYLSEESPSQRVKISATLVQPGYLRVELRSALPGDVSEAPAMVVSNLTHTGLDTTESGIGERWYDPGEHSWFWDGVATKAYNDSCELYSEEDDKVGGGFYAAEYQPNIEWRDSGPPSSAGGPFIEDVYTQFQLVFNLRTLTGTRPNQVVHTDFIHTRRGPKLEGVTTRHWGFGRPYPSTNGSVVPTFATQQTPGDRFVSSANPDDEGIPRGFLLSLEQKASSLAEGARRFKLVFLEIAMYHYCELRYAGTPLGGTWMHQGLDTQPLGKFDVTTMKMANAEWLFALKPQSNFSYEGRALDVLGEDATEDYREWNERGNARIFTSWLLQIRPVVIDRSGRRVSAYYRYCQWAGDGEVKKPTYLLPRFYRDARRMDVLYPGVTSVGDHSSIKLPTGEPGETRDHYWWVHRIS